MRTTLRVCKHFVGSNAPHEKEDRPTVNGNNERPQVTAGLDLGDKYSYPCASSIKRVARLRRRGGISGELYDLLYITHHRRQKQQEEQGAA